MNKSMKKIIQTGYGLGLLSITEAKKVVGTVRKELNLNDEESTKLAKELVKNSKKASEEVLATASKHFDNALVKTGLVTKNELIYVKKTLKKRVKSKLSCKKDREGNIFCKIKDKFKRN